MEGEKSMNLTNYKHELKSLIDGSISDIKRFDELLVKMEMVIRKDQKEKVLAEFDKKIIELYDNITF